MPKIAVTRAEGRTVIDPLTRLPVGDAPFLVEATDPYWARRILDADLIRGSEADTAALIAAESDQPPAKPAKKGAAE